MSVDKLYRKKDEIILQLKGRKRTIGSINDRTKTFTTYRSYSKHLHRKSNSFGFCHELLKIATRFDKVAINTDKNEKFVVPVQVILDKGKFLFFKQQGYEKQIFLELDEIKQYQVEPNI